jgi:hypothetical protein
MNIHYVFPNKKPKITGVVCIDPAGHSGLFTGSLNNDPRWLQALSEHSDLKKLLLESRWFRHPKNKEKGNKHSGTGVFMVTNNGGFLWATLKGATTEVVYSLFQLAEEWVDDFPLFLIERPHPDNYSTLFTCAYIAGALCFAYETEPVFLPPRSFPNGTNTFNAFLRSFGVKYNPTPHELDATLHFIQTFYLDETNISEYTEEDLQLVEAEEMVFDYGDYTFRHPATMNIYAGKEKNKTAEHYVEWLLGELETGTISVRNAINKFRQVVRNDPKAKSFRID